MVRVGVPADIDEHLLTFFPKEAEIIRLDPDGQGEVAVEIWVAPLHLRQMTAVAARVRGVKVVQSLWAGVDALLPFVPAGATLYDGQGVHDVPVAEWIVAGIFAMLKHLPFYVRTQERGRWEKNPASEQGNGEASLLNPEELAGKTVLIAGYGAIGRAVEERLEPFGVSFLRLGRRGRDGVEPAERLDDLLPAADIVVLLVPLTDETRGLINRERLAKMKPRALLVNAARGPVVETEALLEALHAGHVRAVLDVTDPEPLPDGHPLWSAPNLLITPHIGGASARFLERAVRLAADQVRRYIDGKPLINRVEDDY
ncbi:MAG: NAD(P)-dependent oxidoreductase [Acidobacteriaceae bacterium]